MAFKDGALYVAENHRISRYDGVLDFAKVAGGTGPAPKQTVLNDKLPTDRMHGWKYLSFGPDGLLYTQIGAPGNILDRGDPYATIIRMKPDGSRFRDFRARRAQLRRPDVASRHEGAVVHRQRTRQRSATSSRTTS